MKKNILFFLVTFLATSLLAQQKNNKQPNIIWLMAEDISLDLACYGMPAVKTPNLDKMANEGVRFDNCFVTNSICSPSRSSMMVGVNQLKINAQNHRSNRDVPLDTQFKPFTYWLRKAGYTCVLGNQAVMGKGRKIDCNFKTEEIGEWDGETKFGLFDKLDTISNDGKPFFAQIQLVASHRGDWWDEVRNKSKHPVNPDSVIMPSFLADHPAIRLDWAKYLDQIEYLDNEVGMIYKELEEKGLADNTIVIFIGDNGRCNIDGKGYLHDSGLRIPLIINFPKKYAGNHINKDVVSSLDITATILDFAGVKIPSYMQGKPIFDKSFKRKDVYATRDLWDEIQEKSRAITTANWKYIRNDKPEMPWDMHMAYTEFYRPALHIMRKLKTEGKLTPNQALFFAPSKPVEELYNLKTDPEEFVNLVNNLKYANTLEKMRAKTLAYDKENTPVSNVYHIEIPNSVEVLAWVKQKKPELYKEMLAGKEVGFKKLTQEYNKLYNKKLNKGKSNNGE